METYLDAMRKLLEVLPDGATVYFADGRQAPAGDCAAEDLASHGRHLDLLFWGDHCGSSVDGANIRALRRECPHLPWTGTRASGWEIDSLGMDLDELRREWKGRGSVRGDLVILIDTLRALSDYPIADEEELSSLEHELVSEAWHDYGCSDWLRETGWYDCSPSLSEKQEYALFELAYGDGSKWPEVERTGQSVHFPKTDVPLAEDVVVIMFPGLPDAGPYDGSVDDAMEWLRALPRDVHAAGGLKDYVTRFGGQATLGPVLRAARYVLCDVAPDDAPDGRELAAEAVELVGKLTALGVAVRG